MLERRYDNWGLGWSIGGHTLIFVLIGLGFGVSPPLAETGIVYSISLEGGAVLGGVSQVPDKASRQVPPAQLQQKTDPVQEQPEPVESEETVALTPPTPRPTPKATPKPKATPVPAKPSAKPTAKPVPTKKPVATKAPSAADVQKEYQKALQRYLGESSEAGGKGVGAARVGGSGMGGGVQKPPEFFIYRQILRERVKSGWNWYDSRAQLVTWVTFSIARDGVVSAVTIAQSSGNAEYDDSVVRAIYKASPLPPPPPVVYEDFRSVRMKFDPRDE